MNGMFRYPVLAPLMCLLLLSACSRQPPTEHHVLPNGYSGVYRITKDHQHPGGYTKESSRYIFTIPDDGALRVDAKVFEGQCLACNGLSAQFADGAAIPLFSPSSPPIDDAVDTPMLLGITYRGDTLWYAIGTHEELSSLLGLLMENKYQNLDELLLTTE